MEPIPRNRSLVVHTPFANSMPPWMFRYMWLWICDHPIEVA